MQNIIKTFNIFFLIVLVIALIDFAGMMMWALSGQMPMDGFYVGRISTEIIRLII
jgi:hypothetical protein